MILNAFEQKTALDYIVYMMMGSHFERCSFPAKYREKQMEHFYVLLGSKLQIELEEKTENCFLKTIRPSLPQAFLDSEVKAFRVLRDVESRAARDISAAHTANACDPVAESKIRMGTITHAEMQSAMVFANRIGQLWIVTRYGGRLKKPEYYHFYMDAEESRRAGSDRVDALWKKLSARKQNGGRRARKKRPA